MIRWIRKIKRSCLGHSGATRSRSPVNIVKLFARNGWRKKDRDRIFLMCPLHDPLFSGPENKDSSCRTSVVPQIPTSVLLLCSCSFRFEKVFSDPVFISRSPHLSPADLFCLSLRVPFSLFLSFRPDACRRDA